MSGRELASLVTRQTGKFVSFAWSAKIAKTYSDEDIRDALSVLCNTSRQIDDPLRYITGILSKKTNKEEAASIIGKLNWVSI